jgi:hypothetical protein
MGGLPSELFKETMTNELNGWTADQAAAAQDVFVAQGGKVSDPKGPFYQWWAHRGLVALEEYFRAGDPYALALAIRICASYLVPLPPWVAEAYIRGFDDIHTFKKDSWEYLFGRALPKGRHRTALHDIWDKAYPIRFDAMVNKEEFGAASYEQIGKDRGISTTRAKSYQKIAAGLTSQVIAAFGELPHSPHLWLAYFMRKTGVRKSRKKAT